MLDEDVERFSTALTSTTGGLTCWMTQRPDRSQLDLHGTLAEALRHDRVQAFISLRERNGKPTGPIIQYLATDFAESAFGAWTSQDDPHSAMRSGRFAYKWFPDEESPETQVRFRELTRLAWQALNASSAPHLITAAGKPRRNARIGAAAKRWAIQHPGQLLLEVGRHLTVRE